MPLERSPAVLSMCTLLSSLPRSMPILMHPACMQVPLTSAQLRKNRDKLVALLEEGQLSALEVPTINHSPRDSLLGEDELLSLGAEDPAVIGRITIYCTANRWGTRAANAAWWGVHGSTAPWRLGGLLKRHIPLAPTPTQPWLTLLLLPAALMPAAMTSRGCGSTWRAAATRE